MTENITLLNTAGRTGDIKGSWYPTWTEIKTS